MNPTKYMKGMETKNLELSAKNDEYLEICENYAQAERDYKIALARKITELRMNGESITIAKELASGDKLVAEKFYEMRIQEGIKKACLEKMSDLRTAIDTYRSLLSWLKSEREVT